MIELDSLDALSIEGVQRQQEILTQFIQDKYPTLDLAHGVFHDLVSYVNAIFLAKHLQEMDRWRASRSLRSIQENPDLADEDSIDILLSNYNITRKAGTAASGSLMLEFRSDTSVILPMLSEFTRNNITYVTDESYIIYNSESALADSSTDKRLQLLSSGNYGCVVPVRALTTGFDTKLSKGTQVEPVVGLSNLVTAYAVDDFVGGSDAESNDALVTRLITGMSTPAFGNRYNIQALLQSKIPDLIASSICGYADPEMRRDARTLFPVSCGGCVDIYAKLPSITVTEVLPAQVIAIDCATVTWSAVIDNAILPGFWRVTGVVPDTDYGIDSYAITEQSIRSANPNLSDEESFYSVHQQAVVRFTTDLEDGVSVGTIRNFRFTLFGCNGLDAVQDVVSDPAFKSLTADVLVRAAVPCLISASVSLYRSDDSFISEEQLKSIKEAVIFIINNKVFSGNISSADIIQHIQPLLLPDQRIRHVQLTGVILIPGGSVWRDTSAKGLQIPDLPEKRVTPNTVSFYTDVDSVEVTVE